LLEVGPQPGGPVRVAVPEPLGPLHSPGHAYSLGVALDGGDCEHVLLSLSCLFCL
jgi:hypothetical protein